MAELVKRRSSKEENEILTKVGPGTPMGEFFRQFQIPILLSDELIPAGPPKRIRVLGEDLVAFRTRSGKPGLVGELCQHRGASLFFGRIEGNGIRCIYHGWKYGLNGKCLDMPNVPAEYQFKEEICHAAYPCVERGGLIWAYMGPSAEPPPVPDLEFLTVPDDHRFLENRDYQECSYFQGLEGGIDPSHAAFLHGPLHDRALSDDEANKPHGSHLNADTPLSIAFKEAFATGERTPRVEMVETAYGIALAGRRNLDADQYLWRVNHFLFPFITMAPSDPREAHLAHIWVPVDDETHVNWRPRWNPSRPITDAERKRFTSDHLPATTEAYGNIRRTANRSNNYFMDWDVHRTRRFGIPTVHLEDVAISESQGRICDRTKENLTQADAPIALVRSRLIGAAHALSERGEVPAAARDSSMFRGIRGVSISLPRSTHWVEGLKSHMALSAIGQSIAVNSA